MTPLQGPPEREDVPVTDVEVPYYDPAVHTVEDGNPVVRVEAWCACGGALRQTDPVSHVLAQLQSFRVRHSDAGHGPVTAEAGAAEREERRRAGFRAAGRQDEYEPKSPDVEGVQALNWAEG